MGGGGGQSSGSNAFSRVGTTNNSSNWSLGSGLSGLITNNVQSAGLDPSAKSQMVGRVNFNNATTPYMSSLLNTANQNPYSGTYETNTQAQFDNRIQKAMALARTGQENVIAPLNRGQYFREAEVLSQGVRDRSENLAKQREVDARAQIGAGDMLDKGDIGAANALSELQRTQTQALSGAVDPLSTKNQITSDNYTGQGDQSGNAVGAGFNLCCFIFLESFNGPLPKYVRECRDEFCTPKRRAGYNYLSTWVVPAMRVSKLARSLTNALLVRPCLFYGAYYKEQDLPGRTYGYLAKPIVYMWFKVFDIIGAFVCR